MNVQKPCIFALNELIKSHTMTGATYLDFDKAQQTGMKLIREEENPTFGLLVIAGTNLGLRISDLLELTFGDLRKETITNFKEGKTGKLRDLDINDNIRTAMRYFPESEYPDNFHAFRSRKNTPYSTQHVNRLMKQYFTGNRVSSHTLRKTFGRRVWDNDGGSERALVMLNEIFNHATLKDTKKYLGIKQEEIRSIYMNL